MTTATVVQFNERKAKKIGKTADLVRYDVLAVEEAEGHHLLTVRQRVGHQSVFHVAVSCDMMDEFVAGDVIILHPMAEAIKHPETKQRYTKIKFCEKMAGSKPVIEQAIEWNKGHVRCEVTDISQNSNSPYVFLTLLPLSQTMDDLINVFVHEDRLNGVKLDLGLMVDIKVDKEREQTSIPIFTDNPEFDVSSFRIVPLGHQAPKPINP